MTHWLVEAKSQPAARQMLRPCWTIASVGRPTGRFGDDERRTDLDSARMRIDNLCLRKLLRSRKTSKCARLGTRPPHARSGRYRKILEATGRHTLLRQEERL